MFLCILLSLCVRIEAYKLPSCVVDRIFKYIHAYCYLLSMLMDEFACILCRRSWLHLSCHVIWIVASFGKRRVGSSSFRLFSVISYPSLWINSRASSVDAHGYICRVM